MKERHPYPWRGHRLPSHVSYNASHRCPDGRGEYRGSQELVCLHRDIPFQTPISELDNVVEQDHRAVKRVIRPGLGFKAFETAQYTLAGVGLMHRLRKGQWTGGAAQGLTAAEQFYALAA